MDQSKSDTLKSVRDEPLKSKFIHSPIGALIVVANETSVLFVKNVHSEHLNRELTKLTEIYSKSIIEEDVKNSKPLASIEAELQSYFKGQLLVFHTPFEIDSLGTEFQRTVWMEINRIPYGETITYAELAQRIGKPSSHRAVANACGRNPIPVMIPCHRVTASGGKIGGYTGGVEKKVQLLDLEKKFKPTNRFVRKY